LSMWDLWWTEWHWDKFLSYYISFPLSLSFHQRSVHICMHVRRSLTVIWLGQYLNCSDVLWKKGECYLNRIK